MHAYLRRQVYKHVSSVVESLQANPLSTTNLDSISPVHYSDLDRMCWIEFGSGASIKGYYVRHLVDEDRFGLWPIEDAPGLLEAVIHAVLLREGCDRGEFLDGDVKGALPTQSFPDDHTLLLFKLAGLLYSRFSSELTAMSDMTWVMDCVRRRLPAWSKPELSRGGLVESEIHAALRIIQLSSSLPARAAAFIRQDGLAFLSSVFAVVGQRLLPSPLATVASGDMQGVLVAILSCFSHIASAVVMIDSGNADSKFSNSLSEATGLCIRPLLECAAISHVADGYSSVGSGL